MFLDPGLQELLCSWTLGCKNFCVLGHWDLELLSSWFLACKSFCVHGPWATRTFVFFDLGLQELVVQGTLYNVLGPKSWVARTLKYAFRVITTSVMLVCGHCKLKSKLASKAASF